LFRRFILICALLIVAGSSAYCGVTVDAGVNIVIEDQPRISSSLFGITAFEGFPNVVGDRDYRARVEALRPGCFRFGGSVAWCSPKQYDPNWYTTSEADKAFTQTLLYGDRYPYGRFAPIARNMGADIMVSLGNPPDYLLQKGTQHPSDFDRWAEYCAQYIELWRRFDPQLKLVQVWNEPNATWYLDPRASGKPNAATELFISMANKVARAVKKRFPDIRMGGPVLCWAPSWPPQQNGMDPWYTWEMWTMPWLRETSRTFDYFDFHVYSVPPDDMQVQVEMLCNQAQLTQGRRLPVWVTESNVDLKPGDINDPKAVWNNRVLPYERFLLRGILPQADKIEGHLYHDLHARDYGLLPDTADNPADTYWLLWILRDLRGRRVAADSTDPEVITYSTLDEDSVTVVLFNDSDKPKDLSVDIVMPCGYWTGPAMRAIGQGPDGGCRRITVLSKFDRQQNRATGAVSMPPHATISLDFRLDNTPGRLPTRTVHEYFGTKTLQMLSGAKPVDIDIPTPQANPTNARLRIGLLGPQGDESLALTFNGKTLPINPTAIQEIPLPTSDLSPQNHVQIILQKPTHNPRLAIGFLSLIESDKQ
jgi:hypothetical protein